MKRNRMLWTVMSMVLAVGLFGCGGDDTPILDPQNDDTIGYVVDGDYVIGDVLIHREDINRAFVTRSVLDDAFSPRWNPEGLIAKEADSRRLEEADPQMDQVKSVPTCWKVEAGNGLTCRGCCPGLALGVLCTELCVLATDQ